MNDSQKLQQVWDRQEIEQLMYRYARSLDRMDAELMKSTYWEDAVEDLHDPISGQLNWNDSAWAFVSVAMEGFTHVKRTQHRISNILIQVNGDTATAETYVWAYHLYEKDGVDKEGINGGRHLFNLEKRNDEWRIKHRASTFDWNQNQDATAVWSDEEASKHRGQRDTSDKSYHYVGSKNKIAD